MAPAVAAAVKPWKETWQLSWGTQWVLEIWNMIKLDFPWYVHKSSQINTECVWVVSNMFFNVVFPYRIITCSTVQLSWASQVLSPTAKSMGLHPTWKTRFDRDVESFGKTKGAMFTNNSSHQEKKHTWSQKKGCPATVSVRLSEKFKSMRSGVRPVERRQIASLSHMPYALCMGYLPPKVGDFFRVNVGIHIPYMKQVCLIHVSSKKIYLLVI